MNYQGSCGYVALDMLLSYYDTFLNDDIIPEIYDVPSVGITTDVFSRKDSPGTVKDIISLPGSPTLASYGYSLTAEEYIVEMIQLSDVPLHSKLITIVDILGYYDYNAERGKYCTSNIATIKDVFEYYLENIAGLSINSFAYDEYIGERSEESSVITRNFTKQQIMLGNPVLLTLYNGTSGHVVVAYDYDEDTDSIYCHMGYDEDATHVTPESEGYYIYEDAVVLNWNFNHSHNNNYMVYHDGVLDEYCYDSDEISILSHNCIYTDSYDYNSIRNHKANCICGDYIFEGHILENEECIKCSYNHVHNYNNYIYYNNTHHKAVCSCDDYILENHIVTVENLNLCVICNSTVNSSQMGGNITFITDDGSYILPNGIIVLTIDDLNSYFKKELSLDEYDIH